MRYQTQGTCSTSIDIELKDGVIDSVKFTGGCNGNLQGISVLVKGMTPRRSNFQIKGNPLWLQVHLLPRPACTRT